MRRLASLLSIFAALSTGCDQQNSALVAPGENPVAATTVIPAQAAAEQMIGVEATLDRATLTAAKETTIVARIRLDASAIKLAHRPSVDLGLVIDTSGSMVGKPIEEARAAALALLAGLRDGDRLSVVTFDSKAKTLVAPFVVDRSKLGPVKAALESMTAQGTTDLAAGLALAIGQSMSGGAADTVRRVVVLGDGVPNDPSPIPQLVAQYKGYGIAISTLGFGLEYDEVMLAGLAQGTGGRFHRIDSGESIAAAFSDEVMRIERAVASTVMVRVQPGPGVTIRRVFGHPSAPDASRAHSVQLGDLAEGQRQDIFVEMTVSAHRSGATVELLDAIVSYDDRTAGAGRLERTAFVAVAATDDTAPAVNNEVARAVAVARVAAALLDAIAMARIGDFAGADTLLRDTEAHARKLAQSLDEAALIGQAAELAKLRKTLADDRKRWEKADREAQREAKRQAKLEQAGPHIGPPSSRPVAGQVAREPMPMEDLATVKRAHSSAVDALQAH